jgi:peroxiredoxin
MCRMVEDWQKWEEIGVRVFGISVDSLFALQRFREDEKIPFLLLSDFNRTTAQEYDVLYKNFFGMEGVAKRSAFVLDSSGTIAYSWSTDDASVEPDYEAVLAATVSAA